MRAWTLCASRGLVVCLAFTLLAWSSPASARNTDVLVGFEAAKSGEAAKGHLLPVPSYLKGQSHPQVVKKLSTVTAERSTRGAFRSDDASCAVAMLSALRILQEHAQRAGADAVVDIVSTTRGVESESASDFRCVAGSIVVHVGLRGTLVNFE